MTHKNMQSLIGSWLLPVLLACLLAGCKKGMIYPTASGRPYEVLVVMPTAMWEAPAGRALFAVLDTDVPGLPQAERSFRISQTDPNHFSQTMRIFRNIIQVNIDPKQFSQTRMKFMRDKYATDQIVLTINAPSENGLKEFCETYRQDIVDFLTRSEMNRLVKLLEKKHSKVAYDLAWQMFACKLFAPDELKSYKKAKDFFWASNNTATGMVNICMYSYPYEGPETFCKEYILQKRDSVMKENLPGEQPGMYVQTDSLYTDVRPIVVHNGYAMETRGLWYMKNYMMGGPFVSHSRVDMETGRVIVVEGFVYAPEKMKRGLIRRLEGSLYTLQLPSEQYNMEINTGVEEEKKPTADAAEKPAAKR